MNDNGCIDIDYEVIFNNIQLFQHCQRDTNLLVKYPILIDTKRNIAYITNGTTILRILDAQQVFKGRKEIRVLPFEYKQQLSSDITVKTATKQACLLEETLDTAEAIESGNDTFYIGTLCKQINDRVEHEASDIANYYGGILVLGDSEMIKQQLSDAKLTASYASAIPYNHFMQAFNILREYTSTEDGAYKPEQVRILVVMSALHNDNISLLIHTKRGDAILPVSRAELHSFQEQDLYGLWDYLK